MGDGFVLVGDEVLVVGDAPFVKGVVEDVENLPVDGVGEQKAVVFQVVDDELGHRHLFENLVFLPVDALIYYHLGAVHQQQFH